MIEIDNFFFKLKKKVHERRRSRVQAPSDAVPLIFGLHCTCAFSYLFEPLNELTLIYK